MRAHARLWLVIVALVVVAGCLGYLSERHIWSADWSSGHRASVSSVTRAVLGRLHGRVTIMSYARPEGSQRAQIAAFIARYQRLKPDITLSFVDPERDPAATREAGITVNGELVVHYRGKRRYLREIDERHLTDALESLARGGSRLIAFATGDGERAATGANPADLGSFVKHLEKRGIRAVPLNLAEVQTVPQGTRLVVLASPLTSLPDAAVRALTSYLARGGNLLWLADPGHGALGLAPLAEALGVEKLPGTLARESGPARAPSDSQRLDVTRYPAHPITHGFKLSTVFAKAAAFARTRMHAWKVAPILRSGARSRIERDRSAVTRTANVSVNSDAGGAQGPLDFGLALTRLSPGPGHKQQRVVVVGDGDFLSNALIDTGGNRAFGERVFNWLLGDDALIGVPVRHSASAPLELSQAGLNRFAFIFLLGVPVLLVLIGVALGWRRRW